VAGARYDAHPCGYRYKDWVDLDVLQPWDTSLIPNFSQLNPKLMTAGQFDGQQYFVPLDWGYIAPLVNLDHVDGSDETFNVLFDERYKGKIAWVDTLNMMVVAAYALGIENPWDMTDEELAEVRDFLISKKGLVRFYWNQSFDFWRAFKTEEVWAGYSWPDTVGYADAAGMNYLYMQPTEGRISWVCGMALFADSQNYRHAHEYVDSWASKEAAEFLLAYYYYGHTNTTADLDVVPEGVRTALSLDDPHGARRSRTRIRRPSSRAGASTSSTGARCRRPEPATWPGVAHGDDPGGDDHRPGMASTRPSRHGRVARRAAAVVAAVLRDRSRSSRRTASAPSRCS
jgi:spermidine/putrescine-binding protein